MTSANAVVEQASALGDPSVRAAGLCTAAFVHLAVEDLDAVTRDATAGLAAARAGRDRLRAIDARLFLAEAARRRNRRAEAVATIERFRKIRRWLSAAMRARCDLLRELLSEPTRAAEVVGRHIAASGLQALNLFAPVDASPAAIGTRSDPLTDQIVDILQLCQQADDEARVLAEVCDRIQRHLHAAGVAWVVGHEHSSTIVASTGGRIEAAVAARAIAAGIVVAPHRVEGRIEAAAPVWYGGAIIGALGARWTIGSPYDLSRAPAILTMAAAAAAPLVAAVVTRRTLPASPALAELLGTSASMVELRRAIERAAAAPFAVLIDGESGSGKELVARALHRASPRRDRPFSSLNCAALPDDLVEAELFGHGRGAFTGAVGDRAGVFEEAHGGTLFLDEIGELSARAQAKVLRVLQEGELRRVGENVSRRIDVRILAATNRDLAKEAAGGRFRMDLLYRLDVIRLSVPALRDRRDDIPLLLEHYWREAAARTGSRATLAAATLAALARYDWPGNVRELQNVLAALAVRSPKRGIVQPIALPPHFLTESAAHARRLDSARRLFEEHFVRAALVRTGGHRARAAAELGVTRQGLTKLMTRLGINDRTEARAAHQRPTLATED